MSTLLAIDDQAAVLHAIRRAFQGSDIAVATAATGAEGLELVAGRAPDVVLVDLILPDLSGLDVFDRIRRIDRRIPVIIMTGEATADSAIDAIRRGAFDYVTKPLELDALRALVDRAAEVARHMRVPAR